MSGISFCVFLFIPEHIHTVKLKYINPVFIVEQFILTPSILKDIGQGYIGPGKKSEIKRGSEAGEMETVAAG